MPLLCAAIKKAPVLQQGLFCCFGKAKSVQALMTNRPTTHATPNAQTTERKVA